jgi:hypothetical protein
LPLLASMTVGRTSAPPNHSPVGLRDAMASAARFWEPRRIAYNAVLTGVFAYRVIQTWPHLRLALQLVPLLRLTALGVLANVCYCAAYLVDLPLQHAPLATGCMPWRRALWWAGMLFAVALEWYWIGDEIYPYVS